MAYGGRPHRPHLRATSATCQSLLEGFRYVSQRHQLSWCRVRTTSRRGKPWSYPGSPRERPPRSGLFAPRVHARFLGRVLMQPHPTSCGSIGYCKATLPRRAARDPDDRARSCDWVLPSAAWFAGAAPARRCSRRPDLGLTETAPALSRVREYTHQRRPQGTLRA